MEPSRTEGGERHGATVHSGAKEKLAYLLREIRFFPLVQEDSANQLAAAADLRHVLEQLA